MSKDKLPKGWKIATIPDLISKEGVFSDGDWVESKDQDPNGDVRLIQLADIGDGVFRNRSERFLTRQKASELRCTFLEEGDVLIARMPDPLGRACIFPLSGKFATVVDVAIVRPSCDPKWLMYWLNSPILRSEIFKNASGSTRLRISRKNLSSIEFPLPPLSEQQRIVARLDAIFGHLDVLREKLDRIPELLKNFRQQVLTQAVTGELTKKWREGKDLGEWDYEKAENCCFKVQSGGTPKSDGFAEKGIPFLKVYNIVNNQIDFNYKAQFVTLEAHTTKIKKSILLPGDVLMNIVGPPLNKIAIVPDDYKEWNLNQAITLFRPKDYLINKFLYYFFCEGSSVRSVHNETRGVVGQVNISLSQCRNFEIPIPSLEEQKEIVKRIDALFGLADKIEFQYQSLKAKIDQLPQAVLAKAFRGELVDQELKEYVREVRELGMVVEKSNL